MSSESDQLPVTIAGGGIAGLTAASTLSRRGVDYRLFEASDGLGGRMRTDLVDGFLLDRGFHVFQQSYPEAQGLLDFDALDLQTLTPGAIVRRNGKWTRLVDPIRCPQYALKTIFNSIGHLSDRFALLRMIRDVRRLPVGQIPDMDPDRTTLEMLKEEYRFSKDFIESFLRPWLSGIFLERNLETSASFFQFVLRSLIAGPVAYPARGIAAIPNQIAESLKADSIFLNAPAERVTAGSAVIDGDVHDARAVICAVPGQVLNKLFDEALVDEQTTSTTCSYYVANSFPFADPTLILSGDGEGPVHHVFPVSNASRQVAPDGKFLISVNTVGETEPDPTEVSSQLRNWFGSIVDSWSHLRTYYLPAALPRQFAGFRSRQAFVEKDGVTLAGDWFEHASVQGAMLSGRRAAESVLDRPMGKKEAS